MATRGLVLLAKDTFSAVSSVSFDNVFSATYKQYKIVMNVTGSSNDALTMRLRASGSDNSSGNYNRQFIGASSTTISVFRNTSVTSWVSVGRAESSFGSISTLEVLNPFQSTYTSAVNSMPASATGSIENINMAYGITVTTSYDGFSIIPNTGGVTISGTITVYGLAQ